MLFLADLYNFGAQMAFFSVHMALLVLRWKNPELQRPYRAPFNIPFGKGRSLPLTAIFGALASLVSLDLSRHYESRRADRRIVLDRYGDRDVSPLPKERKDVGYGKHQSGKDPHSAVPPNPHQAYSRRPSFYDRNGNSPNSF